LKRGVIQPAAHQELRESTAWYREQNPSVADRFVSEVFRTIEHIERFPVIGKWIPFVGGSARRTPVTGFSYYR